jgi:pimeloyl-ACP methyl ester carboxylesterase
MPMVRRSLFWLMHLRKLMLACGVALFLSMFAGEPCPRLLSANHLHAAEPTRSVAAKPVEAKAPLSRYARCKAWFKSAFVTEADLAQYGMKLDADWETKPVECDVVVLIHGFNSTSQRNGALIKAVRQAGHPCATFNFPNDDELNTAAALLSRELHRFSALYPQRRVTLLAHSAGGLAARACIENRALDPGNVHKLIMIGTPNHGSVLARAAIGMDICEHGWMFGRGGLHAAIADGMCEMRVDLQPCSEFLTKLNARGLNEHVQYTLLLGTGGSVTQWEMDASRYAFRQCAKPLPQFLEDKALRFDKKLAELDEIIAGRGDGAVAVRRSRLDGVKDTVLLGFEHLSVTGEPTTSAIRRVHEVVLERLAR